MLRKRFSKNQIVGVEGASRLAVAFLFSLLALLVFADTLRAEGETDICTELIPESFNAVGVDGLRWDRGSTLTIRFMGGEPFARERVLKYASVWTKFANINFAVVNYADADIRVGFDPGGSWSYVGRSAKVREQDKPTMNFGWLTADTTEEESRRVILHEFGHVLGLVHEHQSPRAKIDWNRDEVYKFYDKYWTRKVIEENIFTKYGRAQTNSTAYDPKSIMHYPIPTKFLRSGTGAKTNTHLSEIDKKFVQRLYPFD